jgi:hypothetical protein
VAPLHAPTLNFIAVLVTLVAAGVSLLTWYHHREGPGLRGWALALLLGSAGTFLFGLRGPDASFRFILIGDALFVAGFATMWLSMRRFNDPAMTAELIGVIVAATLIIFVALFTLAWQVAPVERAQSIVFSLFVFLLASLASWETWRGRHLDGLRSRPIAAVALAGIAAARLVQALMASAQGMSMIEPEVGVITHGYALYFTTVCILVVTFGLVLMAHERFERQYAISTEPGRAAE